MDNISERSERAFSPSRTVWRTQMQKGIYNPHRVSRITCTINQLLADRIVDFLNELEVIVYEEGGRSVREHVKKRPFGIPGEVIRLENTPVKIFRFTVPRENSEPVMKALINAGELYIPGRGSVFSQNLMEFSKKIPSINLNVLSSASQDIHDANLLNKLSYVICVLSEPGSGEQLAKVALDLGICVPVISFGESSFTRDQLGLIRITISAEKELVHLVMPEQDSDSIIKLLAEQSRLDIRGRGFIYQTPVSAGLIDTRLKIGRQKYAASIEQIIAAIDQLKAGTTWRKRLDANTENLKINKSLMPQDNCEISIISDEDRIDKLSETCLSVGASGTVTSRVMPQAGKQETVSTMICSAISVPAQITDKVVDKLLEVSTIRDEETDKIQILDSPAAYVRTA